MLSRNISIYRLLSIFGYPFFWQPVLFLFLTQTKLLLPSQALTLISLYSLGVVILEVPGGAIADHFSRKFSASIGYLLKGIGFLGVTLVTQFHYLLLSMLIVALGESLVSGSLESLIYDTIKASHKVSPKYFKKIFANTRTVLHFSLAIFITAGGYIGQYNLTLPLQLSVIGYLIAASLCTQLVEPITSAQTKNYLAHITDSAMLIFSREGYRKGILQLLLADFFILGLISAMFWLTTPLLNNLGTSVFWIGILTASMRLLKSLGSYIVTKYDDPNDLRSMIITGTIMAGVMLVGGIWYSLPMVLLAILVLYLIQAFYQANDIQILNDKVGDIDRTTLNSYQSMFTRLYEFTVLPIIGKFFDAGKPYLGMITIGILLGVGTMILFSSRKTLTVPTSA